MTRRASRFMTSRLVISSHTLINILAILTMCVSHSAALRCYSCSFSFNEQYDAEHRLIGLASRKYVLVISWLTLLHITFFHREARLQKHLKKVVLLRWYNPSSYLTYVSRYYLCLKLFFLARITRCKFSFSKYSLYLVASSSKHTIHSCINYKTIIIATK